MNDESISNHDGDDSNDMSIDNDVRGKKWQHRKMKKPRRSLEDSSNKVDHVTHDYRANQKRLANIFFIAKQVARDADAEIAIAVHMPNNVQSSGDVFKYGVRDDMLNHTAFQAFETFWNSYYAKVQEERMKEKQKSRGKSKKQASALLNNGESSSQKPPAGRKKKSLADARRNSGLNREDNPCASNATTAGANDTSPSIESAIDGFDGSRQTEGDLPSFNDAGPSNSLPNAKKRQSGSQTRKRKLPVTKRDNRVNLDDGEIIGTSLNVGGRSQPERELHFSELILPGGMDAKLNAPDEELPRGIFADVSGSSLREALNESEEILNGNTIPRFLSTPISEDDSGSSTWKSPTPHLHEEFQEVSPGERFIDHCYSLHPLSAPSGGKDSIDDEITNQSSPTPISEDDSGSSTWKSLTPHLHEEFQEVSPGERFFDHCYSLHPLSAPSGGKDSIDDEIEEIEDDLFNLAEDSDNADDNTDVMDDGDLCSTETLLERLKQKFHKALNK